MASRSESLTGKRKREESSVEIANVEHAVRNRCRSIKRGAFGGVLVREDGGSLRRIQDEERWSCRRNDKPRHKDRGSHDAECGRETALPEKGTRGWIKCP